MLDFQVPKITAEKVEDNKGSFTVEPLDRGFGYTFGNSLRRVLLSSLVGAAVTSVRIEGVAHEFSTIKGVKEDVTDIVLNLKDVVCRMHTDAGEVEAPLIATGPGEITAKDIDLPSGVEILNPDAHIATLEKKAKLEMYLTIGRGRGYRPAEGNKSPEQPIGVIPIDSIFSPVRRVAYNVEAARVGQRTDFDKLTLDIETDGSVDPQAALREAAEVLIQSLAIFTDPSRIEGLGLPGDDGAGEADRRPRGRAGGRRHGRHPDRGAGAGRALLQLPEARRHPDDRRPRAEVGERAQRDPELRPQEHRGGQGDAARPRPRAAGRLSGLADRRSRMPSRCGTRRSATSSPATRGHRKALVRNLCAQVLQHERIQTTEAKAKVVKPEVEKLITLAKRGDLHARRQALAELNQDKFVVHKLFEEIAPATTSGPAATRAS